MDRPWICLMYHDVSAEPTGISGGPAHFAVSRNDFAAQLDQIQNLGLRGCTIAEALDASGPDRVAISFDDGDAGQYHNAFPELVARGMTATFFVTTDWVERDGYVTWSQLRRMQEAGMSIQSHTRSHPFLSQLSRSALEEELAGAKAVLDERLNQSTTMLAFPGGDPPGQRNQDCVARAGYTVVATSRWGSNRHLVDAGTPRYVRRCTIRGTPTIESFIRILADDPRLRLQRYVRDTSLRTLRAVLGRPRYARWRRAFLDTIQ